MAATYHLSNIRTLLTESFSEVELRDFCFDMSEFRPVHHELADLSGKATIVRHLLDYAVRRDLLDSLLAWAKQQNPTRYAQHQPYHTPTPIPASSPHLTSPPRPLRVFLCHAAADKPAVRDLYQRLSSEGFIQPWLDEEELLPGQDWQLEIPKAVRASDVVLVCLSPHAITKAGYVQKEIKFALDITDEQPEGTIFLIPLRLELCDVPERLRKWHWANVYEARGYDRLLRSLRLRAEALGINILLKPQAEESPLPPVILRPQAEESPATPPPPKLAEAQPSPQKSSEVFKTPEPSPKQATLPISSDLITITTPINLELVRVPAGEFLMGSDPAKDKDAQPEEQPQHRVYLSEFYIGKYPITNEQYAAFVKATKQSVPKHWKKGRIPVEKENHPVVEVSWSDVVAFCKWLSQATGFSFRLPTEAEWEKAARGTDGRIYPWGNEWDKTRLNSRTGGVGNTTPVGRYSPGGDSPYGAADMSGNVWEWCSTIWEEKTYPFKVRDEWTEAYLNRTNVHYILRGGAFFDVPDYVRCAVRGGYNPYYRVDNVGFRVVLLPK